MVFISVQLNASRILLQDVLGVYVMDMAINWLWQTVFIGMIIC